MASPTVTSKLLSFFPKYWDAKLGSNLWANLLLFHFGVKRQVPANFGSTIIIPRPKKKFIVGAATEGLKVSPSALSSELVSGTMQKFNGAYSHSDLVVLTAMSDIIQLSVDVLGRDIAQAMDDHIQNQLSAGGLSVTPSIGFIRTNVHTQNVLTPTQILRAVNKLEDADNPRPPEGYFPLIIRPLAAYDLQSRISGNAWVTINQYATNETVSHLYKAALGDLYGTRIFKSTRMKKGQAVISTGASGYRSLLLGPESYFVTEINEAVAQVITKPLGAGGTFDPDNSIATVAAKVFFAAIRADWGLEPRYARLFHGGNIQ
jgi:N4-gp56 family major capsid protein